MVSSLHIFTETIGEYEIEYKQWNSGYPRYYHLRASTPGGGFFLPNAGTLSEARNYAHRKIPKGDTTW